MTRIKLLGSMTLLLAATVSACGGGTGNMAEQHLQFLSEGDASEAQAQYCYLEDSLRLITVDSYELTSESEIDGGTEYVYAVDSPELGGDAVIQVLDSEVFFDIAVTSNAQLNEALADAAELLGEEASIAPAPKREDINQGKNCVFLPFDQFE